MKYKYASSVITVKAILLPDLTATFQNKSWKLELRNPTHIQAICNSNRLIDK